jgi:hypothetical protein
MTLSLVRSTTSMMGRRLPESSLNFSLQFSPNRLSAPEALMARTALIVSRCC